MVLDLVPQLNDLRSQVSELQGKLDALGSVPLTAGRRIGPAVVGIAAEAMTARRRGQLEDQLSRTRQLLAGKERERERFGQEHGTFGDMVDQNQRDWRRHRCDEVNSLSAIRPDRP